MSAQLRPILTLVLLTGAQIAYAATFTANRSEDLPDSNPGDGFCQAFPAFPGGGQCTLRAAIMEANALGGSHTIHLESGRTYTITRQGVDDTAILGDLDIHRTMTILCQNCAERPTINGNGIDRIFDVHDGSLTLRNFNIVGGNSLGPNGGAIRAGAGVDELRLISMRVHGNQTDGSGGAIHTAAALTVVSASELFGNLVENRGAALSASGPGTVSIFETAIHDNAQFDSGFTEAVHLSGTGATLRNSTISNNIGAGLISVGNTSPIELRNTTIAGNSSGGIDISNAAPNSVRFRNSIIARNGGVGNCSFTNASVDGHGYNLYSDMTCAAIAGPTDLLNVDPRLTPLKRRNAASHSTPLHWPSPISPALSAGSLEQFGDYACQNSDQIGETRPQGYNGIVRCDIGAAEVPDDAIFFDSLETL